MAYKKNYKKRSNYKPRKKSTAKKKLLSFTKEILACRLYGWSTFKKETKI